MHKMELVNELGDGGEEWFCYACNRHFILYWPPKYERIMLNEGDPDVQHKGGKNGVRIEAVIAELGSGLSKTMLKAIDELDWGDWEDV